MPERSWRCSTLFHQRSPWFFTIAGSSTEDARGGTEQIEQSEVGLRSSWRNGREELPAGEDGGFHRDRGFAEAWVCRFDRLFAAFELRTAPVPLRVRRALMAARIFSVTGVSVSGSSSASSSVEAERCVSGSKRRMDSISSPKNSMRTGRSISGE